MRQMIPSGPAVGIVGVVSVLAALHELVGLGPSGWVAGVGAGSVVALSLGWGLVERGDLRLGRANLVTLCRAVLVCAVTALVADTQALGTWSGPARTSPRTTAVLVGLAAVALALDAVDGHVARRTGTVTRLGARFDMEVDALLILVLSVHVAPGVGWWVLAVGLWRYLLLVVAAAAPWLRRGVPARRWRKVVAAVQGVALVFAATHLLAPSIVAVALAVGLALLTASFGTEVRELWRLRPPTPATRRAPAESGARGAFAPSRPGG